MTDNGGVCVKIESMNIDEVREKIEHLSIFLDSRRKCVMMLRRNSWGQNYCWIGFRTIMLAFGERSLPCTIIFWAENGLLRRMLNLTRGASMVDRRTLKSYTNTRNQIPALACCPPIACLMVQLIDRDVQPSVTAFVSDLR